jgi:hypothetical protein
VGERTLDSLGALALQVELADLLGRLGDDPVGLVDVGELAGFSDSAVGVKLAYFLLGCFGGHNI